MAAALKPEEVYLCVLCHYYVHPPTVHHATGEALAPVAYAQRIALFLLKLLKVNPSARFPSLSELCGLLVTQLGHTLGGELVHQLEVILTGLVTPDDLANIMEAVGNLISSSGKAPSGPNTHIAGIEPSSVLGLFLRRVRATFLLAPYPALTAATAALQKDLQQAAAAAAADADGQQSPNQGSGGGGAGQQQGGADRRRSRASHGSWRDPASLHDHLCHQMRTVRRQGASAVDSDALCDLLGELRAQHSAGVAQGSGAMSAVTSLLPLALQLQLATAQAQRDYTSALHALHSYVDHAQSAALGQDPNHSLNGGQGAKTRHQGSLVTLASLHTHFGHTQEALDALSESLRSAQQSHDPWCLLHALAALAHLTATATPGCPGFPQDDVASLTDGGHALQAHRLMARCLAQAQELNCPHIASFARLCLARWAVRHTLDTPAGGASAAPVGGGPAGAPGRAGGAGGAGAVAGAAAGEGDEDQDVAVEETGPCPAVLVVQEAQRRVTHVAHMSTLEAAAPPGLLVNTTAGAGAGAGGPPARAPVIPELYGAAVVFRNSVMWGCAGPMAEASMHHAGTARLLAAAAWSAAGSPTLAQAHSLAYLSCWGAHSRAEDVELALAQVIRVTSQHQGPQAARYASHAACAALPHGPRPFTRALAAALTVTAHEAACDEGRLQLVRRLEGRLKDQADPAGHMDAEIELDGLLCSSSGALAAGDLSAARELAQAAFTRSRATGHTGHAMRSLLQLGRVWLAAQQPTKAQQHLHSCLVHAQTAGHDLLAAEAGLLLAHSWVQLDPALGHEVTAQLQDVLPIISAHGGPRLRGEAWRLLADTLLVGAGRKVMPAREEAARKLLEAALASMEQAGMWAKAAHVAHGLALLHDGMGRCTEREEAAGKALWLRARQRNVQLGLE